MEPPTLFDLPPVEWRPSTGLARRSDPETAKAAAKRIDPTSQKAAIVHWLHTRRHPLNRDVLGHLAKIRPDVCGTRLSALEHDGLVRKAGTALGDSGVAQSTWELTAEGRWLAEHRLGDRR